MTTNNKYTPSGAEIEAVAEALDKEFGYNLDDYRKLCVARDMFIAAHRVRQNDTQAKEVEG